MIVALDIRYGMESGASSYIRSIVPRILERAGDHEVWLIKHPGQSFDFEDQATGLIVSPSASPWINVLWSVFVLPFRMKRVGAEVYHPMKFSGPVWNPARTVLTVNSIYRSYKSDFPVNLKTRLFIFLHEEPVLRRAHRIIAVSEFLRDCAMEQYRVPPERIDLVYHAAPESFRPLPEEETRTALQGLGLEPGYILCVGNVAPVKNHITAVRAMDVLRDRSDARLVIAGGTSNPYYHDVEKEVERLGLQDRVTFLGFVRGHDLVALMNGARVLLFPSLTEGCPVTLMEALRCGLPAVVSRRGGFVDVGRDTTLFVDDPLDAEGFARQAARVLDSDELHDELSRKALARSRDFSWDISAEKHIEAYERTAAGL